MNWAGASAGNILAVGAEGAVTGVCGLITRQGWRCGRAATPGEALRLLRETSFDLVLLVPSSSITPSLELCRSIKFDHRSRLVSVSCILPMDQADALVQFFEAGADDCILAGASESELCVRLAHSIRLKHATDSLEDAEIVIIALANAIEGKDHYTCGHVERVSMYSVELGKRMGVSAEDLAALKTGGVVHDVGKVGIPDHILNKAGTLTDEEMAIMRRHPLIGHDILEPLRTFRKVLPIVRWHHERPNGTGYPDGIRGDELPLLPRIAAVADCFDALSTDRPYRAAHPIEKCKAILLADAGRGNLDPVLVQQFCEILGAGGIQLQAA